MGQPAHRKRHHGTDLNLNGEDAVRTYGSSVCSWETQSRDNHKKHSRSLSAGREAAGATLARGIGRRGKTRVAVMMLMTMFVTIEQHNP